MSLTDFIPGGALLDIGAKILDRVIPDKNAAALAKAELEKSIMSGELQLTLGQLQVNLEEAKSTHWFVAGWRPFVGWICGFGLVYQFLLQPLMNGLFIAFNADAPFPILDLSTLMTVLFGILGLGTMRTYEKYKGSEGNR